MTKSQIAIPESGTFLPIMETVSGSREGAVVVPLRLDDVKRLASSIPLCSHVFSSETSHRASFLAYDKTCSTDLKVNVYCVEATVGICLDHPRQGVMQTFRQNVDMAMLCKIFQNPRLYSGYPNLKRNGRQQQQQPNNSSPHLVVGDRVNVGWCDVYGTVRYGRDATVVNLNGHNAAGKIKVLSGDGQILHVRPSQLTKNNLSKPDSNNSTLNKGKKCQNLKAEVDLQIRRLDRELELIQQERLGALRMLQDVNGRMKQKQEEERCGASLMNSLPSPSPTSTAVGAPNLYIHQGSNVQHHFILESLDAHLQSILNDSGAFTNNHDQVVQPLPSRQQVHRPPPRPFLAPRPSALGYSGSSSAFLSPRSLPELLDRYHTHSHQGH